MHRPPDSELGMPPVDRTRRFRFVAVVVTFCLIISATMTVLASFAVGLPVYHVGLIETFIGACMSLATATTLGYITGSVIDYSAHGLINRPTKPSDYVLPPNNTGASG